MNPTKDMTGKATGYENIIIDCKNCTSKIISINLVDSPVSMNDLFYKCRACGHTGSYSKIAWLMNNTGLTIWEIR